jgi:transcriptional regulator with GAF, ATPase, and Fis domain
MAMGSCREGRQLEELYPQLREEQPVPGPTGTIVAPVEQLDQATVIKVSQAISGQIVLEKLIDTLMRTAIEHAGAERGLLILPQGVELRVEAEAITSGDTVTMHLRGASTAAAALAESIVHDVVRTQESVILDDASAQNPFSADTYIRRHHARSSGHAKGAFTGAIKDRAGRFEVAAGGTLFRARCSVPL